MFVCGVLWWCVVRGVWCFPRAGRDRDRGRCARNFSKSLYMDISTMKRANELLTIEGVSAFRSDSLNSNCYFTAASKVSLKLENEAPVVGYLLVHLQVSVPLISLMHELLNTLHLVPPS